VLAVMPLKAKTTRVDNAYERLKTDILNGDLPPGFQAPEPDIAARLGMSRTPVREALIRLEAEGLVGLIPRHGARVLPVSQKDICEVFHILAVLEGLAAETAARRGVSENLNQEIREVLDSADAALSQNDIETWVKFDDRFHRLIADSSGNVRLDEEISCLLDQVYRSNKVLLLMNNAPAASSGDHRKLLEAIVAGKANSAAEIARCHRLGGLATMKRLLQQCGLSQI
jgi:DNA-binding GntR family transcriptional regulator